MDDQEKTRRHWLQNLLIGILLAFVLAATFMAYLRPAFVVDLANRLVLCM